MKYNEKVQKWNEAMCASDQIEKKVEEIRKRHLERMRTRKDAADDKEKWITVNGTHVQVGENGKIINGPHALKQSSSGSGMKSQPQEQHSKFKTAFKNSDVGGMVNAARKMQDGTVLKCNMKGHELTLIKKGDSFLCRDGSNPEFVASSKQLERAFKFSSEIQFGAVDKSSKTHEGQRKSETQTANNSGTMITGKDISGEVSRNSVSFSDADYNKAIRMQGFDKKPTIAKTKREFNDAVKQSGLYMSRNTETRKAVSALKNDDSYTPTDGNGNKTWGEGIYFYGTGNNQKGTSPKDSDIKKCDDNSSKYGNYTVKATLNPNAKVCNYHELKKSNQNRMVDAGYYAATHGYDAVIVKDSDGCDRVVVVNRTALIISP